MTQILVFGDSITWGACDSDKGGWVERLKVYVGEHYEGSVYNLGVSGDTTEDLLERFEFETTHRLEEDEETIIIFDIGINDSQFIHSQNSNKVPPQEFQGNLQKLINLAQKFSSKIVFVGLFPVDETKTIPIPWDKDKSYKNEYIKKYNNTIRSMTEENKLYFIDVFNKLLSLNYQILLEDGLHPNAEGHQKIFETVRGYLIENKILLLQER